MEYKIRVVIQLQQDDTTFSAPVLYKVEEERENVTIYNCTVDLPADKIPAWLTPGKFSIKKVYSPGDGATGVTVHSIKPNPLRSLDATFFADQAMHQIRVNEINRKRHEA